MTYRDLIEQLNNLADVNPDILDQTATVFLPNDDEYFALVSARSVFDQSELDDGHVVLVVSDW